MESQGISAKRRKTNGVKLERRGDFLSQNELVKVSISVLSVAIGAILFLGLMWVEDWVLKNVFKSQDLKISVWVWGITFLIVLLRYTGLSSNRIDVSTSTNSEALKNWQGPRPWVGGVTIIGLMVFEYWFISNGFKSACPAGKVCDPSQVGWGWPISILVPMAGVMTFLGVLLISNIFSKRPDLSNGEMRKAITGGLVVTYIFFIMTILFSSASPVYRLFPPTQGTATAAATEAATTEATTGAGAGDSGVYAVRLQGTEPAPTEATPEPVQPTEVPSETEPAAAVEAPAPTEAVDANEADSGSVNTPVELAASIIKAFTSLVGVVVGFYFSTRSIDNYNKLQAVKSNPTLLAKMLGEDE